MVIIFRATIKNLSLCHLCPPFLRPTPIHIDDLTWHIRVVVCDCLCLVNKRNGAFFIAYLGWGPTLRIVSVVTAEKTIWKAAELCVCVLILLAI